MSERLIVLGDMHRGRHGCSVQYVEQIANHAADVKAQLILNGDIVHCARRDLHRVLQPLIELAGRVSLGSGEKMFLLQGNHDLDSGLQESDLVGGREHMCLGNGAYGHLDSHELIYHGHQNPNLLSKTYRTIVRCLFGIDGERAVPAEQTFNRSDFVLNLSPKEAVIMSSTVMTGVRLCAFLNKTLLVNGHDHQSLFGEVDVEDTRTGKTSRITVANPGIFQRPRHYATEIDTVTRLVRSLTGHGETSEWVPY